MCQLINAACLIANVLDIHTTQSTFQLRAIGLLGEEVETALHGKNVAVDWTRPSVMEAFSLYSVLFELKEGEVRKGPRFDNFRSANFVANEFNVVLSDEVVETMRQTIRQRPVG